MKKIASLLVAGFLLTLTGCNTFEGIGKDVQKGGQVLEDAAKKK